MLLIYWIYRCLKYKGGLNFGIALAKRQIIFLIVSEILLFGVLFLVLWMIGPLDF